MSAPHHDFHQGLRIGRIGLALAVLTILFGFAFGGAFGAFEAPMKADLAARAQAVSATVYGGDAAKIRSVVDKSWSYYKRAHLHGGAIGASAPRNDRAAGGAASAEGDVRRGTALALQLLDDRRAELFGLVIEVGSAARTATMRLGSELGVRSAAAEAFVQQARAALADPGALVELRAASVSFVSGRDLLTFAATRGLGIRPGEVEQ
nr:hypothetical protein [Deltaproteobacteria bacterium]